MQAQEEVEKSILGLDFSCGYDQQEKKSEQSGAWLFPYDSEPILNSRFFQIQNPSIRGFTSLRPSSTVRWLALLGIKFSHVVNPCGLPPVRAHRDGSISFPPSAPILLPNSVHPCGDRASKWKSPLNHSRANYFNNTWYQHIIIWEYPLLTFLCAVIYFLINLLYSSSL